jgi:hypothetical protein
MDQQAPCHGKKANKMMAFGIPEHRRRSAIGAACGRFFHRFRPALPTKRQYSGFYIRSVPLRVRTANVKSKTVLQDDIC